MPLELLLSCAALAAQSPVLVSTPAPALRAEVTPLGAFVRECAPAASAQPALLQSSGTLWDHADGGLHWVGNPVALGNHGSEVLAEYEYTSRAVELFSAFDSNPPTALWSDTSIGNSDDHHVAQAESADVKLSMRVYGYATTPYFQLAKYSSRSAGVPDWTYVFPTHVGNFNSRVAVSRDGNTIVAAACNTSNSTMDIAVFGPSSNVPVSYTTWQFPSLSGNTVRGFDLSADGSTLYFCEYGNAVNLPYAHLWDVASHTEVFTTLVGATFDAQGISGDGSVFAYGLWGQILVWKKSGGTYTSRFTVNGPGSSYVGALDLSDDGSTLAAGWTIYSSWQQVEIRAIDVVTQAQTMSETVTSSVPSLQNVISGVSISADGERFAVGLWGDGTGAVAEARLYSKHQNAPLVVRNQNGSVFGVSISADGQRAAFGNHDLHANNSPTGGDIALVGVATPFASFCFGNGSLATACPCANNGLTGRGCENSSSTGGALLTASGATSPDTVVLTASGELPHPLSIVLQGSADVAGGSAFGDGVRCAGGTLKRLYARSAVNGVLIAPAAGDASISARSAQLGDPIASGQTRTYQVYYRDNVLGFCPAPGDAWNVTSAVRVSW